MGIDKTAKVEYNRHSMNSSKLTVIGTNALVGIEGIPLAVPAKIDTGADGTAIWASNIHLQDDGSLCFVFFDKQSPLYTGEVQRYDDFKIAKVTSSTGHGEFRFVIQLPIEVGGKRVRVWCSLTDRSRRTFPMLIGKRTLKGKFIVDVSKAEVAVKKKHSLSARYTKAFHENPAAFIEKYKDKLILKDEAGV